MEGMPGRKCFSCRKIPQSVRMEYKKPPVSEQSAVRIAQSVFGLLDIVEVKEFISNYDRNYYIKTRNKTSNKSGVSSNMAAGNEFIIKLLNAIDSQYPESIMGEIKAMEFLRHKGFPCPQVYPVPNKNSDLIAIVDLNTLHTTGRDINDGNFTGKEENVSIVRLIAFSEGTMAASIERNPEFLYTVGKFVGSLSKEFKDFTHKGITERTSQQFKWNILEFLDIEKYINVYDEHDDESKLIQQVHQLFVTNVKPHLGTFRTGAVHNDVNGENILITYPPYKVTGLLDFGDLVNSVLISEISNCMTFFMKGMCGVEFSGYILSGYQSTFPLPANEYKLLYYFILARLSQLVMYSKANLMQDPSDVGIQDCLEKYYGILKDFWRKTKEEIEEIWQKAELAMAS